MSHPKPIHTAPWLLTPSGIVLSLAVLFLSSLFSSCTPPDFNQIEAGDLSPQYPGEPHIRMRTKPILVSDTSIVLSVQTMVDLNSLIYTIDDKSGAYRGRFNYQISVFPAGQDQSIHAGASRDTVFDFDPSRSKKTHSITFQHTFRPGSGDVQIAAEIRDRNSQKSTVRTETVTLPSNKQSQRVLWADLLNREIQQSRDIADLNMYQYVLADTLTRLNGAFQVFTDSVTTVSAFLVRYRSDTTIARLPMQLTPSRASIEHKGVDYAEADTIFATRVNIQPGDSLYQLSLPVPRQHGNYRFGVALPLQPQIDIVSRDFALREPSYPNIGSMKEMAQTIRYIAYDDEFESISEATNRRELRNRFDHFWLDMYGSEEKAMSMLSTYTDRVEQANQQFPSYKAGWKTDMGMIYILFGPPIYVEQSIDGETWYYPEYNFRPGRIFTFAKIFQPYEYFPFHHYVLQRDGIYMRSYIEQREKWRRGEIE